MTSAPRIAALFIGQPKAIHDARGSFVSSINRDRVPGPVQVSKTGFDGDKVAQPYHGGPDAAVCAHLADHYLFWNARYDMNLHAGSVGENLTLENIAEDQIFAGDIVRIGSALLQVSGPRVPCANLARRIGRPDWVRLTVTENRTGFYMRVLEPGAIQQGDPWQLEQRLNDDASIPAINRCMYLEFEPGYARRMLQMNGLGKWWKEQALEKLERQEKHWTDGIAAV